jgi:hypothetical protein
MKKIKLILLVSGVVALASCGNGNSNTNDSTSVSSMDTSSIAPMGDTVPAAEMPAGAVNPGEDSSRYGTGANDSTKQRRPQ